MNSKSSSPLPQIKVEAAAFRIWQKLGHPHPQSICLEDIAMSRNLLVVSGPMKNADGRLLRKGNQGIARISDGITQEGRRRFTIAHELGHWEIHPAESQLICTEQNIRDYGNSSLESEANFFAASLLMPSDFFRTAIGRSEPSLKLIKSLANDFQTTLTATAIRFADLSKKKIIVVWSSGGKISWSYRNPKHTNLYVIPGSSVPIYSSAALDLSDLAEDMDHYDQSNWFPQLSRDVPGLMEVTMRMNTLNAALTLLWIP